MLSISSFDSFRLREIDSVDTFSEEESGTFKTFGIGIGPLEYDTGFGAIGADADGVRVDV